MTFATVHAGRARLTTLSLVALGAVVPGGASAQAVTDHADSARSFENATPFLIEDLCADRRREECIELQEKFADGSAGLPPVVPATVYPSAITVPPDAFAAGAKIKDINVTIRGISHAYLDDVDILLVGPDGKYVMLASNVAAAGGNLPDGSPVGVVANDLNWKFDDSARLPLPNANGNEGRAAGRPTTNTPDGPVPNPLYDVIYPEWKGVWTDSSLRTFKPTDYDNGGDNDVFPAPAPQGLVTPPTVITHSVSEPPAVSGGTLLSTFNGSSPVGAWKLYVVDDFFWFDGSVDGWSLEITTE